MATYKTAFSTVSYVGWQGKWGSISEFSNIKWGVTMSADIVYENKKRYLHVTSATLKASFYINSAVQESFVKNIYAGVCTIDNTCVLVKVGEEVVTQWTYRDFREYPLGQPGSAAVTLKARYYGTAIGGTGVTGNYTISGFNLGGGLSTAVRNAEYGAQSWTNSSTVSCNIKMEIPNEACHVGAWMKSYTGEYRDWGQLWVTPEFPLYVPNTPGTQYYTGSKWETHKIKRWNGSSWVDIPGRRWSGSAWDEIQG